MKGKFLLLLSMLYVDFLFLVVFLVMLSICLFNSMSCDPAKATDEWVKNSYETDLSCRCCLGKIKIRYVLEPINISYVM